MTELSSIRSVSQASRFQSCPWMSLLFAASLLQPKPGWKLELKLEPQLHSTLHPRVRLQLHPRPQSKVARQPRLKLHPQLGLVLHSQLPLQFRPSLHPHLPLQPAPRPASGVTGGVTPPPSFGVRIVPILHDLRDFGLGTRPETISRFQLCAAPVHVPRFATHSEQRVPDGVIDKCQIG